MAREDLGFVQKDLYVVNAAPAARPASPEAALAWYDEALRTLKAVPGVRLVAGADAVVTSGVRMRALSSAYPRQGLRYQITAGYFETVGTRPLAGRTFTESEVEAVADVAIVNAAAARLIWPNDPAESVVGRVLHLPDDRAREVVGVVPGFKSWNEPADEPALFLPKGAEPSAFDGLVVRMEPGRPLDVRTVQAALAASVGDARLEVRYVPASLEPYLVDPRFRAILLGVLAVTGLVLAAIGLYAVASADVATRRFETGVRLALGATGREVSARVIRDTCRPVLAGVALGLVISFWFGRFVQSFLHQVDARDPWTYAVVALTLVLTAVAAGWLPARRAASTDPATVLRAQ
jgi:hypothetical protein